MLDLRGAREAGLFSVAALYGYGKPEALLLERPDRLADDPAWTTLRPLPLSPRFDS